MRNVVFLSDGVTEVANIVQGSFVWKSQVNTGNALRFGSFCVSTIEFDVYADQAAAITGGDTLYYKWEDDEGNLTDKGVYYADPVIAGKRKYHVTASAGGVGVNNDYSKRLQDIQSSFPMTLRALADDVCNVAGLTLKAGTFPHSTANVYAFLAPDATCRQMLSWIAEIAHAFVRTDYSTGEVYFGSYTANTANTIGPTTSGTQVAYKQDGLEYANYIANRVKEVWVQPSIASDWRGGATYTPGTTDTAHGTYYIRKNPVLAAMVGTTGAIISMVAEETLTALNNALKFRPATVQLFKNECPFDVADIVTITDIQGVTFTMPVMSMTFADSGATLTAEGSERYEDNTTANAGDTIVSNSADIAALASEKVSKVNGESGPNVVLDASDVGAIPSEYIRMFTFTANQTRVFNMPSGSSHLLVAAGPSAAQNGLYILSVTNGGAVSRVPIQEAGSLTLTAGTNSLTIESSASVQIFATFIRLRGGVVTT